MRTILITIVSMTLVGCGLSSTQAESTVTTTATLTQSAEPTSDISDISELILEAAWSDQSLDDRDIMCWGWEQDQERMLDAFFAEIDEDLVTREQAITFFNEKC